jgi:diguanylate cyclase (GGDEF)-like protein/PAS domain S-box-containing protein
LDKERSRPRTSSSKGSRGDSEARWDWNLESDRIHFSPRWVALAGCEDHEVGNAPEDWFRKVHPEDREKFEREIETARFGDATTFECQYRLRHKDGTYRWMSCRGMVVRDNAGRAIRLSGSESDVTVTMVTDRLTRLPNRLLLVDRVTQSIERARRYKGFHFALLMIDLGTPTSLGHSSTITDTLLTAVARRLETCLRLPGSLPSVRHNDLVARMEGHYFAILLDGLRDIGHAKIAADRILGEMLNPFTVGGREVRLSASIGIALSATGYGTADEVLTDAETALHRARVLGGSHSEVFDTDILKSEQTELQLEGDLEGALQRREFVLFYQPIVSLESNEVLGFESLLRWRHPVLGMIAPLDFIPIAERTGFIVPLGAWVLHEACRRLAEWHRSLSLGDDLWVSVNISSAQLTDPTLIDQIQLALHDSGLEPRRLALELTEGIAIANPSAVTTLLMELRAVGVRICVDDFGTGYSSLAYLRQFPIDTLKIDRSFVRGMVTNKDTAEIVAGVMNLSKQLGLRVVAEGVEDEDQCDHLRALNCHAGQGHLFAKPLDLEGAVEVLKTGLAPRPERRRETMAVPEGAPTVPRLFVRGRRLVTRRVASFAAAIVALLSAGVLSVVKIIEPASSDPVMPPAPTITRDRTVEPPAAPSAPPVTTEKVARITSSPPVASPSPAAPSAKVAQTLPLDVIHLHRFGDCRGQLDVSPDGVAFLSQHDSDTFTLTFAEFLHALSDDTLTLKSATKTYRFKASASGSDGTRKLREFADRIARARR